jgi:NAD(P)-dependent dehydrogenase (short-subunit alcohol dehydrogenase family)
VTGRLAGSAVVVTGGAAGLGLAYARRFLREGACVFIADIVDPAAAVASLDAGDQVGGCRVDVASAPSVDAMVETAHRRLGRIDVLINNAAVFASLKPQPFDAIPEEEWDRVMAVNVRGMWNCIKAVAPVMRAQKAGRIVNVASAIVAKGTPFMLHYVASKGAVIAMTRALARELGDDGIAVNAVAPGLILSDTVRANPAVTSFQSASVLQSRAFKRDAVPEDVEGAVVFLASPDSAFMTGQTLVVDGGSVFV